MWQFVCVYVCVLLCAVAAVSNLACTPPLRLFGRSSWTPMPLGNYIAACAQFFSTNYSSSVRSHHLFLNLVASRHCAYGHTESPFAKLVFARHCKNTSQNQLYCNSIDIASECAKKDKNWGNLGQRPLLLLRVLGANSVTSGVLFFPIRLFFGWAGLVALTSMTNHFEGPLAPAPPPL